MKPNSKKRSSNKSGAVLVTAVAVLLIMSILMTATVGYVSRNRTKTNSNYSHKQAYLTASTTLKSFVAQIEKDTSNPTKDPTKIAAQRARINALISLAAANGGKGTPVDVKYDGSTDPGYKMGTTKLVISQDNGSATNLVVTAYTTYAGKTEKVAAHISTETRRKPAEFTNTIETHGDSDQFWDNLFVIGDTAILNNNANKTYKFQNDNQSQGSYIMYGSVERGTANAAFILKPNIVDSRRGTFVQISEDYLGEMKCYSLLPRADGYNYVFIGGVANLERNTEIGYTADKQVDIITRRFKHSGNTYKQHGNIYCYKGGSTERNGDASFSGTSAEIWGDVNVEGDLICNCSVKVHGNVNVGGTVQKSGNLSCDGTVSTGVTLDKTGRGSVPSMEVNADDYKFFPEDFFMGNAELDCGTFSNKYKGFYNGTYTKTVSNFKKDVTTSDGAKFRYHITECCSFSSVDVNNSDLWNGGGKILIDVTNTSGDIVIMLRNGLSWGNCGHMQMVVRNSSDMQESKDDDGNVDSIDHKYNCYFVSDSGDKIKLKGKDEVTGKSKHEGSVASEVTLNKFTVMDYDTFIHMFSASDISSSTVSNPTTVTNSSFVFNPSNEEIPGAFKPSTSDIMFLMGDGSAIHGTNDCWYQACVYAPNAIFDVKTNGLGNFTACDSAGNTDTSKNINIIGIGVFIAKKFNSDNRAFYVYTKPSGTSLLTLSKGNKSSTLNGFVLDRYDHH